MHTPGCSFPLLQGVPFGKEDNVGKKRRQLESGTSNERRTLRIGVGRPWNGKLEVKIQRFMLLKRLSWVLVVLVGALGLQMLVNNDTGLARQLASLLRDILLVVIGGLSRSVRQGT
jgi:hypothetical protein